MADRILLVEDDSAISEMVVKYLTLEGFEVTPATNGEEGVLRFLNGFFDLVILDIMMPKLDGMEVMRVIRERSHVPILIVSAKDSDVDKAVGLGHGADDYIAKPFSMIELSARIKAAIRRSTRYAGGEGPEDKIIRLSGLTVDVGNFRVTREGEEIRLTNKEFEILKLFAQNPNRVFTKAQIYKAVWANEYYGDENVINVHMRRLREKIEPDPSNPRYIKTLWGIGYRLGDD